MIDRISIPDRPPVATNAAHSFLGILAGILGSLSACQPTESQKSPADLSVDPTTGAIRVNYRGLPRLASRNREGQLVIEGDILVTPEDQWGEATPSAADDVLATQQFLRVQGYNRMWPRDAAGTVQVPYEFVTGDMNGDGTLEAFPDSQRQRIITAMNDLMRVVPGLNFRPRVGSEAHRLVFKPSISCSSPLGMMDNGNTIILNEGCTQEFITHHEIMHSLGLDHEHSRSDRGPWLSVQWKNILGCTSKATSIANCGPAACKANLADCGCTQTMVDNGWCYMGPQFNVNSNAAPIGTYDYDSLMHYGAYEFCKDCSLPTLIALQPLNGAQMGQDDHLSMRDQMALRVLYPYLAVQTSAFAVPGQIQLCGLAGRESDIATQHTLSPASSAFKSDGTYRTDGLMLGQEYTFQCTIRSSYWSSKYTYPNTTVGYNPAVPIETYASPSFKLTPLDPGIIALLGP